MRGHRLSRLTGMSLVSSRRAGFLNDLPVTVDAVNVGVEAAVLDELPGIEVGAPT